MYESSGTSSARALGAETQRRDPPKLQNVRDELAAGHDSTEKALTEIELALDRMDGAVPTPPRDANAKGGISMPITLVGSLYEQASYARTLADRAQSLAARLAALG